MALPRLYFPDACGRQAVNGPAFFSAHP